MKLNEEQVELLIEIDLLGPISTADLASDVGRTQSATRSAARRLTKRGLVAESYINGGHTNLLHWITTEAGDKLVEETREQHD
jgi:predicted transcriptional regulator